MAAPNNYAMGISVPYLILKRFLLHPAKDGFNQQMAPARFVQMIRIPFLECMIYKLRLDPY